jgi:hypothetical protein
MVGPVGLPLTPIRVPRRLRTDPIPIGSLASLQVLLGFVWKFKKLKRPARGLFMVGPVGLEPTSLAATDFKSVAYTDSATGPIMICAVSL